MLKHHIRPVFSEKTLSLAQGKNQYTFLVNSKDTKYTIKDAVEKAFGVQVLDVQIVNIMGQVVRRGKKRLLAKKADLKKAIVKLPEKEKIDLFETEEKKGKKKK